MKKFSSNDFLFLSFEFLCYHCSTHAIWSNFSFFPLLTIHFAPFITTTENKTFFRISAKPFLRPIVIHCVGFVSSQFKSCCTLQATEDKLSNGMARWWWGIMLFLLFILDFNIVINQEAAIFCGGCIDFWISGYGDKRLVLMWNGREL